MNKVYCVDSLEMLKSFDDTSIDIMFTDPPYALGSRVIIKEDGKPDYVKGRDFAYIWDVPDGEYWEKWFKEAIKKLKYGGRLLMFSIDRQNFMFKYYAHLSGFRSTQSLYWYFASNFPKAMSLSEIIDKRNGTESIQTTLKSYKMRKFGKNILDIKGKEYLYNKEPASEMGKKYAGYKYSLAPFKQVCEEIMVFQKPYKNKTCVDDVLEMENGDNSITCGAVNIDGSRIPTERKIKVKGHDISQDVHLKYSFGATDWEVNDKGRYPSQGFANKEALKLIEKQTESFNVEALPNEIINECKYDKEDHDLFVYAPKVTRQEREYGLKSLDTSIVINNHPTVKPISLLCKVLNLFKTPNRQLCYDGFAGSGSIGIACKKLDIDYIGSEINSDYVEIANARMGNVSIYRKEPEKKETGYQFNIFDTEG